MSSLNKISGLKKVSLYVDGACKGNPGRGGWGCYAIYHPELAENGTGVTGMNVTVPGVTVPVTWSQYGSKKHTTNNEMELSALAKGLRLVKIKSDITVYADTQYGLKGLLNSAGTSKEYLNGTINKNKLGNDVKFTGWVDSWAQNGWQTKGKKPVANKQLWIDIMVECKRHILGGSKLRFVWVKGHSGIVGNEIADSLADLGAKNAN